MVWLLTSVFGKPFCIKPCVEAKYFSQALENFQKLMKYIFMPKPFNKEHNPMLSYARGKIKRINRIFGPIMHVCVHF